MTRVSGPAVNPPRSRGNPFVIRPRRTPSLPSPQGGGTSPGGGWGGNLFPPHYTPRDGRASSAGGHSIGLDRTSRGRALRPDLLDHAPELGRDPARFARARPPGHGLR